MGVKGKMIVSRPDVASGLDAQWLLNRFKNGKKISRKRPSGSLLPPFGVRNCPRGFVRGAQKWGKILACAFLRANSVLRRANDLRMSKIDVNPNSLPIPILICYLFSKFEE